jgi:hypothetical protein
MTVAWIFFHGPRRSKHLGAFLIRVGTWGEAPSVPDPNNLVKNTEELNVYQGLFAL